METAQTKRDEAAKLRQQAHDSFDRCDTDGFLSQWASNLNARLKEHEAELIENGGRDVFPGLYEKEGRRIAAKFISGQYGFVWLLRDDEAEKFGRRFIPASEKSKVRKTLGMVIRREKVPARAKISGKGKGLSGAACCQVITYRTGDEWGLDAIPGEVW